MAKRQRVDHPQTSSIPSRLSAALLRLVGSFADEAKTIARLSRVCKNWTYFSDDSIWKPIYLRDFELDWVNDPTIAVQGPDSTSWAIRYRERYSNEQKWKSNKPFKVAYTLEWRYDDSLRIEFCNQYAVVCQHKEMTVYDVPSGELVSTATTTSFVSVIRSDHDHQTIAMWNWNHTYVEIRSVPDCCILKTMDAGDFIDNVFLNGSRIVLLLNDQTAELWDWKASKRLSVVGRPQSQKLGQRIDTMDWFHQRLVCVADDLLYVCGFFDKPTKPTTIFRPSWGSLGIWDGRRPELHVYKNQIFIDTFHGMYVLNDQNVAERDYRPVDQIDPRFALRLFHGGWSGSLALWSRVNLPEEEKTDYAFLSGNTMVNHVAYLRSKKGPPHFDVYYELSCLGF